MSLFSIGFFRASAVLSLALWFAGPALAEPATNKKAFLEIGVARWGADYSRFAMTSGKAEDCAVACFNDEKCRSWTFVRPGVEGPTAQCRLKTAVPFAAKDPCCVSGIASGSARNLVQAYANEQARRATRTSKATQTPRPNAASTGVSPQGLTAAVRPDFKALVHTQKADGPPKPLLPPSWPKPN